MMNQSQSPHTKWKKLHTENVVPLWFYLREISEKAKPTYRNRKQINSCMDTGLKGRTDCKGVQRNLLRWRERELPCLKWQLQGSIQMAKPNTKHMLNTQFIAYKLFQISRIEKR